MRNTVRLQVTPTSAAAVTSHTPASVTAHCPATRKSARWRGSDLLHCKASPLPVGRPTDKSCITCYTEHKSDRTACIDRLLAWA